MRRMPAPLFLLILILVALNLRPALSSLAPLLDRITQDLGLSTLAAGLLTTLPVVCLGIFAPLAPRLARRLGVERTLSLALVTLGIALWLRASDMALLLYLGTLLCGGSIGVAGTLLPAIVKRASSLKSCVSPHSSVRLFSSPAYLELMSTFISVALIFFFWMPRHCSCCPCKNDDRCSNSEN